MSLLFTAPITATYFIFALPPTSRSKDKELELTAVHLKQEQLDTELQDLNSQESKDEASLSKMRKQLRDIEAKAKDQEEELDEQAGTIQMLEKVRHI